MAAAVSAAAVASSPEKAQPGYCSRLVAALMDNACIWFGLRRIAVCMSSTPAVCKCPDCSCCAEQLSAVACRCILPTSVAWRPTAREYRPPSILGYAYAKHVGITVIVCSTPTVLRAGLGASHFESVKGVCRQAMLH